MCFVLCFEAGYGKAGLATHYVDSTDSSPPVPDSPATELIKPEPHFAAETGL